MTTTSELKSKLESQSEEISQIAHKIENRLESYKDWPSIVRQYPFQSLGAAVAIGLLLSGSRGAILKGLGRQFSTIAQAGVSASVMAAISKRMQSHQAG